MKTISKGAKNLMRMSIGKNPTKNNTHASRPALRFDTSTPDMGDRRTKAAKSLLVKR